MPLSNLDAELRVQMRVEIFTLHRDLGNTVEAMTMADKIVALNGGRIEQVGAPLEPCNHPKNPFVAGFIGSPKMIPRRHDRGAHGRGDDAPRRGRERHASPGAEGKSGRRGRARASSPCT